MAAKATRKSSSDNSNGILAFLCYLLWPVGVVLLLLDKREDGLGYHAWNGIGLGLAWWIVGWIASLILWFLWPLGEIVWILGLIYAIVLGMKAYNGEKPVIPLVTDLLRKNVKVL